MTRNLTAALLSISLLLCSQLRAEDGIWRPAPKDRFDWQLSEPFDLSHPADFVDLDLFDTPPETLANLKHWGVRTVCYLNAGAWEDWRDDAPHFPDNVLGRAYDGWAGERWLDIRAIDALAPVMRARLDLCRDKGFDSVEPDNIDGYDNPTGFPITRADQVRYNLWLAGEAHTRGLSIALKNAPQLLDDVGHAFDWALLEDCHAQGWCDALAPFVDAGKAVVAVEYTDQAPDWPAVCAQSAMTGIQPLLKTRDLTGWSQSCD